MVQPRVPPRGAAPRSHLAHVALSGDCDMLGPDKAAVAGLALKVARALHAAVVLADGVVVGHADPDARRKAVVPDGAPCRARRRRGVHRDDAALADGDAAVVVEVGRRLLYRPSWCQRR